ncbi:MAG: hypothetical protein EPO32_11185 [Anaerolineae bacterium]|nr:MAG: hypothetical protein EPO32_11185 [Anaerolineae bacterium]
MAEHDQNRPYRYRKVPRDLRPLVHANPKDLDLLKNIGNELACYRRTWAAKKLLLEIENLLEGLGEVGFPWRETEISNSPTRFDIEQFAGIGMLGFMEYSVSKRINLSEEVRREILDDVFLDELPTFRDENYSMKWGYPNSATRLKTIAYSIVDFAIRAKHNDSRRYRTAIGKWESDLLYLKNSYYNGTYDREFPWKECR